MRFSTALVLALSALATTGASLAQEQSASERHPNIVFITIDTLRADHLSSWDYHLKTSPNIDKLASEGVQFKNAFTVTSRTAPSHFSMFTGRYPQEHGAKLNGFAPPDESKFLYLPQILKNFGYVNGAFVSAWPLTHKLTKLDRYFDVYDQDLGRKYQTINSMRWAEDVAPRAISWMERNKNNQFLCWIHFFDPHSPYDFREAFEAKEPTGKPDRTKERGQDAVLNDVKAYNSEILYTDHWVGKVMEAIDEMGLRDNTLVVLLSDHGESLGEKGYQGHSRRLWESIVHIPWILRMPGELKPTVVNAKVSTIDVAPTILDLTVKRNTPNAKIPTEFVGRSLAQSLRDGQEIVDRPVRAVAFAGQAWIMPKWFAKLWLRDLDFPLRVSYRNGQKKVIWTAENDELEIFDLGSDPHEMQPKMPEEGAKVYEQETEALTKWFKSTHLANGQNKMGKDDIEALKSLGYIE